MRDLGAVYLPCLADDWLVVPPEETVAFLCECARVLAELPAVTAARATFEDQAATASIFQTTSKPDN
ncbi:hypothetical protein [Dactylosporangium sp. NPDC006015]|uniref:hypothetical protein n=1 Tax=Dactylosporangium sp. NPDC006015 TaxID=3154576 RepID=UPI0033B21744